MLHILNNVQLKQLFSRAVVVASLVYGFPVVTQLTGLTQDAGMAMAAEKKKRRTPALRQRVYSQLSQAQKLADEKKPAEGLEILAQMESRIDQLNSYESAMVFNFKAFILYGENQINQAIVAFKKVLEQQPIPEALEKSTLYALAQLQMQQEKYDSAIDYVTKWAALNEDGADSNSESILANAYYAKKDFERSLTHINKAIQFEKQKSKTPSENLLILKRATHYELKQPKLVTKVSEDLVRFYPKPKYWIELGNMYGEIGEEKKQLAVMEAAYQQGFIDESKELKNLAQLYYMNGAPYKAGQLMEQAINESKLEKNIKNYDFLAQSWMVAKEYEKAIPVLQQAALLSDDGNAYARLTEVFINTEQWEKAIEFGKKAQEKGDLKHPGNVSIAMGMAYFNLRQFDASSKHFAQAKEHQKVSQMAEQWMNYVSKEQNKWAKLDADLRSAEVL